jgi:two-component system OmpR family response regulator
MDSTDRLLTTRPPTAAQPLLGLTMLLVEDSRFASDAIRLMCQRSGARLRRADCLTTARRHLAAYRPSVVIVDLGLPDGSGADLLADLATSSLRLPVLIGTSGDPNGEDAALQSGADGFLAKPIASLATFQSAILQHLPPERQPRGLRELSGDDITPDPIALRDDLTHAARLLRQPQGSLPYITQFLRSLAESADDSALQDALQGALATGQTAALSYLVQQRLADSGRI